MPTTFHSRSAASSRAAMRPLAWTRPMMKPMSSSCSARSWPALPAATQTLRPGLVSAASIQRLTALESSCAWPLVPRLMLIESGQVAQLAGELEQVVDGVRQPAGVVEREAALGIVLGYRDQNSRDPGPARNAAVAGGDRGHMSGVGARRHLRLRLELVGRQALGGRARDRVVELLLAQLRAVVELARAARLRRRARDTALVPDPLEPGAASGHEVRMGEIEAADVDQSHQHALARAMRPPGHTPERRARSNAALLS